MKRFFDILFDVVIVGAMAVISFVAVLSLVKIFFANTLPDSLVSIDLSAALGASLTLLILVKMYTLLYYFVGDHRIKLIDLFEIGITAMVIEMVFSHDGHYGREQLSLLVILLVSFGVLRYWHYKGYVRDEMTLDRNGKIDMISVDPTGDDEDVNEKDSNKNE